IETSALFLILLALSAFFSAVEIAFFSLSPGKVRSMVRRGVSGATIVERLRKNPQRLLVTVLLGNNLVNIFAAALATQLSLAVFGSFGIGVATGAVTLVVLVFGEIFPKAIAHAHARRLACKTAYLVLALQYLLFPIIVPLEYCTRLFFRLTGTSHRPQKVSEDEIRSLMHIGVEEGSMEQHEREFVDRLFQFSDITLDTIMMPIDAVIMVDGESLVHDVADFIARSGYSRFPVYEKNKQNIVGVAHIKKIFRATLSPEERDQPIVQFAKQTLTFSPATRLIDAFYQMQSTRIPHALVKKDNATVVGFVTIEDVLEELVGEIYDESDKRKYWKPTHVS
ncbi:MAG: hemolysin family protein, partial [bacterium]|nr:hemolysin family protein [bacterium]